MRVRPIPQVHRERFGRDRVLAQQVIRHQRIVGSSVCESLGREPRAILEARRAFVAIEFGEQTRIVGGIHHNSDIGVVLGGATQHRRPAHIDVLDDLVIVHAGLRHRCREGIEIHDEQVDGQDAFALHHRIVGATAAEEATVDLRMQRLDAPVHDLRKAREIGHFTHFDAGIGQRTRGTAGGQQLHATRHQLARELQQPGLVRNGNESAADRQIHGYLRPFPAVRVSCPAGAKLTPTGRTRAASCAACRA